MRASSAGSPRENRSCIRPAAVLTGPALGDSDERLVEWSPVETAPNGDSQTATGSEDAPHLADAALTVVEEHHGELAEHGVETTAWKGQVECVAAEPGDGGRDTAGHRQHLPVEIDAGNPLRRSRPPRRFTAQRAGAASHVQDTMSGHDLRGVGDGARPGREDAGDIVALEGLGLVSAAAATVGQGRM